MSYTEVRRLIEEGQLDQAIIVARKDIEEDKNEWSCLGLFDVIKECCVNEIKSNNADRAEKCLSQMEVVAQGVKDQAKAFKTIETLRNRMIPGAEEIMAANRAARQGDATGAYRHIRQLHHENPLDERLHEQYGQLIYYYLREGLRIMGTEAAEDALNEYLSLKNPRPSSLHSSIVNMASHVSTEYDDIKLLPFIERWGIKNLTEEDLRQVELSDRVIAPLYQRLIDRCFQMGYSIEEISNVFLQNESITKDEIIDRLCRKNYSSMYDAAKRGRGDVMRLAVAYTDQTAGRDIKNQYHSKALSTIINSVNNDSLPMFSQVMENWGFNNFRDEDWNKSKRGNKEMPSLAQRAIQTYMDSVKAARISPADNFEDWLREAVKRDPKNEFNQRQLARFLVNKGDKESATAFYKKLLLNFNKPYLWYEMSMTLDDRNLKLSCLCKSMLLDAREETLGDIRLELAKLMIEDNLMEEAQRELLSYYNTCIQFQLRLKPNYDELVQMIAPGTQPTPNNRMFYIDHANPADAFIISDAVVENMKVIETLIRHNKAGRDYIVITMLSANGTKAQTNGDKLGLEDDFNDPESLIGKNMAVKYIDNDNHIKVISINETNEEVDLSSLIRVGYVDGLDNSRGWYHIYGKDSAHFVAENPSVKIKIGDFVEFYPIIPKDSNFKTAAIVRSLTYKEGVEKFGTIKAVIARVDYCKHQFNCVSEGGLTGMVGYDHGTVPQPGEMLRVTYIEKKDKSKVNTYIKYISVEPSDETCEELRKVVEGPIHLLKNEKNFEYGFINFEEIGYYVSGFQMKGKDIAEGDIVRASVVNNGDNWFAFEVEKVNK